MKRKVLTRREKEVVELKMKGLGDKEIAAKLQISYGTVRNHLEKARLKYSCSSTFQLIAELTKNIGFIST